MEKKDFKILVVDDDEIAREVVGSLLSREGYPVLTAKSGQEAIEIIDRENIMLVITDLRMPEINGIDVLKYAIKSRPDICVVILTAYGTMDTTLEAVQAGAYDYLTKPFKGQEIIILAERAFQRAQLIEENGEMRNILHEAVFAADASVVQIFAGNIERLASIGVLTNEESEVLQKKWGISNGKSGHSNR